jgi:hypothetical protein
LYQMMFTVIQNLSLLFEQNAAFWRLVKRIETNMINLLSLDIFF